MLVCCPELAGVVMGLGKTHVETSGATDEPSPGEVFDPLLLCILLAHLIA